MKHKKKLRFTPSNDSTQSDYNPYKNRHLPNPTNDVESLAHILKGILGTGMVALPEGFCYAGGAMAIIYSFLNGILCTMGMHILIYGFYNVCCFYHLPVVTYTNAMKLGMQLGPEKISRYNEILAKITDFFIVFYQCGVICIYILFVSVTLQRVTNNVLDKEIPLGFYMLIMVIPCMLINSLKDLNISVPFSYLSLSITCFVVYLIFYYCLRDGLPDYKTTRHYYSDIKKLPMFFGTTVYSFTSVPVVVSVENNMKNPQNFHKIYNLGVGFIIILYLNLGFFSYWRWGDDLQSAVNLNFPQNELLAKLGNYGYALAIFISIGLNGIIPVQLLLKTSVIKEFKDSGHPILWEYVLRIGIIVVCFFMAITIPLIGELISLLGAIALSNLAFIFPGILDLSCRYKTGYGRFKFWVIIDSLLIIWGAFGLLSGIYVNIKEISMKISFKN
nr:proton-coupled amino acid transporter-like protein CG1139 [Onthophagus taurus]